MNTSEIQTRHSSFAVDIIIVEVNCDMDMRKATRLRETIKELINKNVFKIIIDLGGVNYVNSAGIAAIMAYFDDIRSNNGDIKFINLTESVKEIFTLFRLSDFFGIYENEEAAIKDFK